MQKILPVALIAMSVMALLSFTNLFGFNLAGISVLVGVAFFFITKATEKTSDSASGLNYATISSDLRKKGIWFWVILPALMDGVAVALSKLVMPQFVEYVLNRAGTFVSFDQIVVLLVQLAVLALGEEIAWRAFFQKQLNRILPITPVLLISSALFALGHWTILAPGTTGVVLYNLFFVFVNSVLYGIIFYKTNNAWISWLSHFLANLLSIIFLPFFL